MKSFPKIKKIELLECFDRLTVLFSSDKRKLLDAAVRATAANRVPIVLNTSSIDDQIAVVRERVGRTADLNGQQLLISWIEELYDDLSLNHAVGVSVQEFTATVSFVRNDNSTINYHSDRVWKWTWELQLPDDNDFIGFCIRDKALSQVDVVPDYILQYIETSVSAYNNSRPAAALALMSIALEGTLRDALALKGYTYTYGESSEDSYKFEKIHVRPSSGGFEVSFPDPMPIPHSRFLAPPETRVYIEAKIKRGVKWGRTYLEIRDITDLLDYWSSDVISVPGREQISGLGAAITIGRGSADIIDSIVLPPDTDKVIKTVRNNLIHLSGNALQMEVIEAWGAEPAITLKQYLENDNKVFDLLCSIGQTINSLYIKIASGTLIP